jgi:succinyl-diaminopimelate desuccinylase
LGTARGIDLDRMQRLAEALIAAPSPNLPGDERAVAKVVTDALEERGLPAPRRIAKEEERPNLLSTIDFGPGGGHLCLCGHMDTKPVGSAEWDIDPFEPTVEGDRLYGLGACDMKAALAAIIEAAASLDDVPRGRLSLLFTADEEYMAVNGARFLAESQALEADAVVIAEPGGMDHDWDRLHLLSRGIANFTLHVFGDQGHSSLSDQKPMVNASLNMARLLVACSEEFRPRARAHPLVPGGPTINPGVKVSGGVNFGVFPGHASFSCDVRTLPGMSRADFERDIEEWLKQQEENIPDLRARIEFEPEPAGWLPATEVDGDAPLVGAVADSLRETLGSAPPVAAFPGTTDAAWLQGVAGIPTLPAVGPGLLENAHRANEFVSLAALEKAPPIYAGIARRFCPRQLGESGSRST